MSLYDAVIRGIAGVVGIVAPGLACRYLAGHRALRSYEAGKSGGIDRLWNPGAKAGNLEVGADWRKVVDKARDLVRNNGFVSDAMRKYVAYTVGTALWPQSRVKNDDGKGLNKPVCEVIEAAFADWAEACCVDRRDWDDLKKLVARHFKTDGEVLIHKAATKRHPYLLELLEPDQIDAGVDGDLANGNRAIRGIEYNKVGEPVAYHLYEAHPGANLFVIKTIRTPADQIIHIYDPERITENRGICHFAPSIIPAYTHAQQKQAVMDLLRIAAAYGIFVETEFPEDFTYGLPTEEIADDNGTTVTQPYKHITPAGFHYMRKGEKITHAKPEQPTAAYKDFEQSHLRQEAAGFGMSYETFTGDLSNVNYSSLRGGQLNERVQFRMVSHLLVRKLGRPVFREWMDAEILLGKNLKLPGYWRRRADYQRVSFDLPGLPQTDPLKEEDANTVALANATTTRRGICETKGLDFDDVMDQLQAEMEEMKSRGLFPPPVTPKPRAKEEAPNA